VAPRGLPAGELLAGLQRVARGNTWVAPQLGVECDLDYLQRVGNDARVDVPWQIDRLTPRQREILQLIAEGQDARSIAERLSLSIKTVETHRAQLMERLGLFDVALLTRFAVRCGLVSD
jgi:DNA-binding NarL/FixJ family response regulator